MSFSLLDWKNERYLAAIIASIFILFLSLFVGILSGMGIFILPLAGNSLALSGLLGFFLTLADGLLIGVSLFGLDAFISQHNNKSPWRQYAAVGIFCIISLAAGVIAITVTTNTIILVGSFFATLGPLFGILLASAIILSLSALAIGICIKIFDDAYEKFYPSLNTQQDLVIYENDDHLVQLEVEKNYDVAKILESFKMPELTPFDDKDFRKTQIHNEKKLLSFLKTVRYLARSDQLTEEKFVHVETIFNKCFYKSVLIYHPDKNSQLHETYKEQLTQSFVKIHSKFKRTKKSLDENRRHEIEENYTFKIPTLEELREMEKEREITYMFSVMEKIFAQEAKKRREEIEELKIELQNIQNKAEQEAQEILQKYEKELNQLSENSDKKMREWARDLIKNSNHSEENNDDPFCCRLL
jgi:vacuolar-type H+-ATPase subunit H